MDAVDPCPRTARFLTPGVERPWTAIGRAGRDVEVRPLRRAQQPTGRALRPVWDAQPVRGRRASLPWIIIGVVTLILLALLVVAVVALSG